MVRLHTDKRKGSGKQQLEHGKYGLEESVGGIPPYCRIYRRRTTDGGCGTAKLYHRPSQGRRRPLIQTLGGQRQKKCRFGGEQGVPLYHGHGENRIGRRREGSWIQESTLAESSPFSQTVCKHSWLMQWADSHEAGYRTYWVCEKGGRGLRAMGGGNPQSSRHG